MCNFKVGDRVKISDSSMYYLGLPSNPTDCVGTIIERHPMRYSSDLNIRVEWDNGNHNSYGDFDLEFAYSDERPQLTTHQYAELLMKYPDRPMTCAGREVVGIDFNHETNALVLLGKYEDGDA